MKARWIIFGIGLFLLIEGEVHTAEVKGENAEQPLVIEIEKIRHVQPGQGAVVCIRKVSGPDDISGFDFELMFAETELALDSASLGAELRKSGHRWAHFDFQESDLEGVGCPKSKAIHISARLSKSENEKSRLLDAVPNGAELVELSFQILNNREFNCDLLPIRFVWRNCTDNTVSTSNANSPLFATRVFDASNSNFGSKPPKEITERDCSEEVRVGGPCKRCGESQSYVSGQQEMTLTNGGIEMYCTDSIDARDARQPEQLQVMLSNYLLYGESVIEAPPQDRARKVADADANLDGRSLTVADLIYSMRIMTGDARGTADLVRPRQPVILTYENSIVKTNTSCELGGMYFKFASSDSSKVINMTPLRLLSLYNPEAGELIVLLIPDYGHPKMKLKPGLSELVSISGSHTLVEAQVADYDGNLLGVTYNETALTTFATLLQPTVDDVNCKATFDCEITDTSSWDLIITSSAGNFITGFRGKGPGRKVREWDFTEARYRLYVATLTTSLYKVSRGFRIRQ